jgi:hypothetical protein
VPRRLTAGEKEVAGSGAVRRMLLGPAWEHSARTANRRLPRPGLRRREEAARGEVSGGWAQEGAATRRGGWSRQGCFRGGSAISMEGWGTVKKIGWSSGARACSI